MLLPGSTFVPTPNVNGINILTKPIIKKIGIPKKRRYFQMKKTCKLKEYTETQLIHFDTHRGLFQTEKNVHTQKRWCRETLSSKSQLLAIATI